MIMLQAVKLLDLLMSYALIQFGQMTKNSPMYCIGNLDENTKNLTYMYVYILYVCAVSVDGTC